MKCRRVEKFLPLYVEGDLASGVSARISAHLEWCGRCNWLVDEYKDSQSWLRSSEPPAFDDAALNALKSGVLRQIAEAEAKPSLVASLIQGWNRRHVFALSTAALIILGMVLLYVYQSRARGVVPAPRQAELEDSEETPQPKEKSLAGGPVAPNDRSQKRHHSSKRRSHIGISGTYSAFARRAPSDSATEPRHTQVLNNTGGESSAVLRIEFQTNDPNIRIIWFSPKEADSQQTKPATD